VQSLSFERKNERTKEVMVSNEDISFSVFQKKERKTDRQIDRQKEKKENELSEISADTFLVH